jgi:hypothetical protein
MTEPQRLLGIMIRNDGRSQSWTTKFSCNTPPSGLHDPLKKFKKRTGVTQNRIEENQQRQRQDIGDDGGDNPPKSLLFLSPIIVRVI